MKIQFKYIDIIAILTYNTIMERWLSGLKQKFTKLPMGNSIRGFKSYSFRLIYVKVLKADISVFTLFLKRYNVMLEPIE